MACKVTKHGKVRWQACVKKDGARRQRIFASRKEALDWEAGERKSDRWKTLTPSWTLIGWANEYLDFAQHQFIPSTYKEKKSVFKRFLRFMPAEALLSEIELGKLLQYFQEQANERSGYAANKDRKNLGAGWNWGRKYLKGFPQGLSPFLAVEKQPEVRHPRYVPPEEDFWKVYEAAEGQDKVMLLTFLHLAARRNEVFGLHWSDIDFISQRVRLWTRKRRAANLEYDWLPMTKELKNALLWWRKNRPFRGESNVFLCLSDTPFCHDYYGQPFRYRLQFMRRLCDRAGVKRFGFHAIRHLTASILYHLGYEVAVIQSILRHKNPSTTDRYLKSLGLEQARTALEELSRKRSKVLEFRVRQSVNKEKALGAATPRAEYIRAVHPSRPLAHDKAVTG